MIFCKSRLTCLPTFLVFFSLYFLVYLARSSRIYLHVCPKFIWRQKHFTKFAQLPPESTARPSLKWPNEPAWRQQQQRSQQRSPNISHAPLPLPLRLLILYSHLWQCLVENCAKSLRCTALPTGKWEWNPSGMRVWNVWMASSSSAHSNKLQRKLLRELKQISTLSICCGRFCLRLSGRIPCKSMTGRGSFHATKNG